MKEIVLSQGKTALVDDLRFVDDFAAAVAYDCAAREHFGEFAKLNFPLAGD